MSQEIHTAHVFPIMKLIYHVGIPHFTATQRVTPNSAGIPFLACQCSQGASEGRIMGFHQFPIVVRLGHGRGWLDHRGHIVRTRGVEDILRCPYRTARYRHIAEEGKVWIDSFRGVSSQSRQ